MPSSRLPRPVYARPTRVEAPEAITEIYLPGAPPNTLPPARNRPVDRRPPRNWWGPVVEGTLRVRCNVSQVRVGSPVEPGEPYPVQAVPELTKEMGR